MQARDIYVTLSRYNSYLNPQLLDACSNLSDEERKRDMGVPFRSIHNIWNHLLLTDRGWLARFEGQPFPYAALDLILYDDFEELRAERTKTDATIAAFAAELTDEKLGQAFSFRSVSAPQVLRTFPFFVAVSQLFNHQTHHRGQITALLEQLGGDCGVTDLGAMRELDIAP